MPPLGCPRLLICLERQSICLKGTGAETRNPNDVLINRNQNTQEYGLIWFMLPTLLEGTLLFLGCFETRSDYVSEAGCNLLQPTRLNTQVLRPQTQVR